MSYLNSNKMALATMRCLRRKIFANNFAKRPSCFRLSTAWDLQLYFPYEERHATNFSIWKMHHSQLDWNLWTLDLKVSMLTIRLWMLKLWIKISFESLYMHTAAQYVNSLHLPITCCIHHSLYVAWRVAA